jgi:hypothetical protein
MVRAVRGQRTELKELPELVMEQSPGVYTKEMLLALGEV